MEKLRKKSSLSPYLLVILSFAVVIIIGSFLLVTPFAQASGKWAFNYIADDGSRITYLDCLFTAVSATCVTGLCSFVSGIGDTLSFTGQLIVLVMVQIGGLGFITVLTFVVTLFQRRLQFKNRFFLSQALSATNFAEVVSFVRKIIIISFIAETAGFLIGLPVAFTLYQGNITKALWSSVFTSVSAFNNAGFDIFGNDSLIADAGTVMGALKEAHTWAYYYYLCYIMLLVIIGGISFMVVIEVFSFKKTPRQYSAFTKIVLTTTFGLLVFGAVMFYLTEHVINGTDNFTTMDAIFQSVTCRTAGFATFDQSKLTTSGKTISCFLMFIGGSPLSTAGGIKTTTFFIIVLAMVSHLRGKQVVAFKRLYNSNTVLKGMTLMITAFLACMVAFVGVSAFEKGKPEITMDKVFFETFSAFGTVGLSANLTPLLSDGSKIILCIIMFLGRLGPMTFFQVFKSNIENTSGHFEYVEADFLVG